jgi:hypothetical protein
MTRSDQMMTTSPETTVGARRPGSIVAALLVLAPLRASLLAQAVDPTTLRPTDVVVTISNDTHYDGTYRAHGISRVCGKLDLMMPHRANSFVVEFPDAEPDLAVRALSFDADTLASGSTITSFYLSVGIRTPEGGTPPAFVVRAREPRFAEPGTATRATAASRDSLTVSGIATSGTKVRVRATVVCQPKP